MPRYYGESGYTNGSLRGFHQALKRVKENGFSVTLVTYVHNKETLDYDPNETYFHGFILRDYKTERLYVVRPGFASGYGGEGPRGLADCFRALGEPPTAVLYLRHSEAMQLFDMELTNAEIINLLRFTQSLKVIWDEDARMPSKMNWFTQWGRPSVTFSGIKENHPYYEIRGRRR